MAIKFTDAQLVALSAASQRDDLCIAPTPQLRGAVAKKFAEKLLAAELAHEVPAARDMPVWRRDDNGDAVALRLTEVGLAAIGVADEAAPACGGRTESDGGETPAQRKARNTSASCSLGASEEAPAADVDQGSSHGGEGITALSETLRLEGAACNAEPVAHAASKSNTPRTGTKLATLIAMLTRADGATVEELSTELGWLPHTTRAAITGLRKRNFAVSLDKADKARGSIYRIRIDVSDGADCEPSNEDVQDGAAGDDVGAQDRNDAANSANGLATLSLPATVEEGAQ